MLRLASISKFSCLCSQLIIYRWSRQNYSKDCFLIMYLGEVNEGFCGFKFLSCKSTGQRMPCIFSIREEFYLSNFITYCDFSTRTKWKNDKQKYSSLKFYYMLAKFCLSGYRLPETELSTESLCVWGHPSCAPTLPWEDSFWEKDRQPLKAKSYLALLSSLGAARSWPAAHS